MTNHRDSWEWKNLDSVLEEYAGKWVAQIREKVVAFGDTVKEVLDSMSPTEERPVIWHVPELERSKIDAYWLAYENIEDIEDDSSTVCTKHKRFIPCRPCMHSESDGGGHWNSKDSADVKMVRDYQSGEFASPRAYEIAAAESALVEKMPLRVESMKQLDSLPIDSVILDYYGFAWQKSRYLPGNPWRRADGSELDLNWARDLPELIIHVPSISKPKPRVKILEFVLPTTDEAFEMGIPVWLLKFESQPLWNWTAEAWPGVPLRPHREEND